MVPAPERRDRPLSATEIRDIWEYDMTHPDVPLGRHDQGTTAYPDDETTPPDTGRDTPPSVGRLDLILMNKTAPMCPTHIRVAAEVNTVPEGMLSDHLPVIIDLVPDTEPTAHCSPQHAAKVNEDDFNQSGRFRGIDVETMW